jgi:hypothetical protein
MRQNLVTRDDHAIVEIDKAGMFGCAASHHGQSL